MANGNNETMMSAIREYMQHTTDIVSLKNTELVYLGVSAAFAEIVGYSNPADLIGKTNYEIFTQGDYAERYTLNDKKLLVEGETSENHIEPLPPGADGLRRYVSASKYPLRNNEGKIIGLLGICRDITSEYKVRQYFEREKNTLLNMSGNVIAVVLFDVTDWKLTDVRYRDDIDVKKYIHGEDMNEYLRSVARSNVSDDEVKTFFLSLSAEQLTKTFNEGKQSIFKEYKRINPNGTERWVSCEIKFNIDPVSGNLIAAAVLHDIDNQKHEQSMLRRAAEEDSLTRLLNHDAVFERIRNYLSEREPGSEDALLLVDLDSFKLINDNFGHRYGDKIIVDVAHTLIGIFRNTDVIGRIGGDEFIILMKNIGNHNIVIKRTNELLQALQFEISCGEQAVAMSASIGVVIFDCKTDDFELLYSHVDSALYDAKKKGKSCYSVWNREETERRDVLFDTLRSDGISIIQLHTLLEYMDGGIILIEVGEKLRTIYISPSFYKMTGRSEGDIKAQNYTIMKFVIPEDVGPLEVELRQCVEKSEPVDHIFRVIGAHGKIEWRRIRAVNIPYKESNYPVLIAVISDVTKQRELEGMLAELRHPAPPSNIGDSANDKERHTVLVVDDNIVNRRILERILCERFDVLQAANGLEALNLLKATGSSVSAILLDLEMPVMDGYAFMRAKDTLPGCKNIPVIVATGKNDDQSELDALRHGACDYVIKPFKAEIIRFRLSNAIVRSQLSAFNQLRYLADYDEMTGIYNKKKFFTATREMLLSNPHTKFVFARFDINRFSLINSYFGTDEGDSLLKYIACCLKERDDASDLYTYGRIESDIFCYCLPYENNRQIEKLVRLGKNKLKSYNLNFDVMPTYGFCIVDDPAMPPDNMYDCATLASKSCKGDYIINYAIYDTKMRDRVDMEQRIVNQMNSALKNGQFVFYLQPQVDLTSGRIVSAEALVRWIHPERGMVSPYDFIPVFERNGFIERLDHYIWEEVCILLKKWQREGKYDIPLSINISRVNLYNPRLTEHILRLTEKYGLPNNMLHLELTESAYTDNPEMMRKTMSVLRSKGFIIMMDDFGSGYSSLNMLKDITVDVLKLDMQFLASTNDPERGRNIIAAILRMAQTLNMPVVAEGVEFQEQADFLKTLDCNYAQGNLYAKPMPVAEFEQLMASEASENDKK